MLIAVREKKHCIIVKAIKENKRDREAVRRAFRWAFRALPASSPSTPNRRLRMGEDFLRLSCSSPVFLMASRGVSLLSFRAGSQAESHMVATATSRVAARIRGWYPGLDSCRPWTASLNSTLVRSISPIPPATPRRLPKNRGRAHKEAASCSRQVRICFGVAPMLEKMPN